MSEQKSLDELIARARSAADHAPDSPTIALLLDLCDAVEKLVADQREMRREAFLDGIRGAAKAIQSRQATGKSDLMVEPKENADVLAAGAARIVNVTPIRIDELRRLRHKINSAIEGNDEIDDELKRIYYSIIRERDPSSSDILPSGSPSRSLDVATFLIERVLREGWWTLGNSGTNVPEKPLAKVGRYAGQDAKAQSAATTVLTLLSAWVLTLIEAIKGK